MARAIGLAVVGGTFLGFASARTLSQSTSQRGKSKTLQFMSKLKIVPYSVLGTSLQEGAFKVVNSPPQKDDKEAIVDPAGLPYISGKSPISQAGAASGSIYKWLNIRDAPKFPSDVSKAITKATDAKYYEYDGSKHVVHVVGPDFRMSSQVLRSDIADCSKCDDSGKAKADDELGVRVLSRAYENVLRETAKANQKKKIESIRLLPISGGVFAAHFKSDMHFMTFSALMRGFSQLSEEEQDSLLRMKDIKMCIFLDSEVAPFERAHTWMIESMP
eukprot:g1648.t1